MGRGGPSSQASWTTGRSAADSQTTVSVSSSPFSEQNLKRTSSCLISEELHEIPTKSSHNSHHTHTHAQTQKKKEKEKILILILGRKPGAVVKLWRQELSGSHPSVIAAEPQFSLRSRSLHSPYFLPTPGSLPPPGISRTKARATLPSPSPSCVLCTY